MKPLRDLVILGTMCWTVGCAEKLAQNDVKYLAMHTAVESFETGLRECTTLHKYDPDDPGNVGPNQLAPAERAWSECVYDALRATIMGQTAQPELYEAIIDEHKILTDKIDAGLMTRSDRSERMSVLRDDLRSKELARMNVERQLASREGGATSGEAWRGAADSIRRASINSTRF